MTEPGPALQVTVVRVDRDELATVVLSRYRDAWQRFTDAPKPSSAATEAFTRASELQSLLEDLKSAGFDLEADALDESGPRDHHSPTPFGIAPGGAA